MTFDSTATTKLYRWTSWQVSFSDRYLTNPAPGTRKYDVLLTTGIRMAFGTGAL